MKLYKLKLIAPEKGHREVKEVLGTYFEVIQDSPLKPTDETGTVFFAYYMLGAK
jgi:hypothetical protein